VHSKFLNCGGNLIKRVLVAYDGSIYSWKALEYACSLSKIINCAVRAIYVVEISRFHVLLSGVLIARERLLENGAKLLEEARQKVKEKYDIDIEIAIRVGHPVEEVINEAKHWNANLIVIGARGAGGFRELILGSVAEALIRHSPIPILIVK